MVVGSGAGGGTAGMSVEAGPSLKVRYDGLAMMLGMVFWVGREGSPPLPPPSPEKPVPGAGRLPPLGK